MADRPNIFLITVDSLRADHCGFMGYDRDTTPTLDAMAEDGLVFEHAIAPGPTTPESTPAMFTGQYPTGAATDGSARGRRERIRQHMQSRYTLAERLSDLGYRTAGFTPNPWTSRYFSFGEGFDRFEDFMDEDRSEALWERMLEGNGSTAVTAVRLLNSWIQRANTFKPWDSFVDEVFEWINSGSDPYFVWVFLLDPHFPYLADRENYSQSRWRNYEANLRLYLEDQDTPYSSRVHEQLVTAYDDSVRYTDEFLHVVNRSVGDDTRIVVTADHGEAFGEHGTYGHHDELFEENIRVPLVVSGGPTGTERTPVSLRHLPQLVTGLATDDGNGIRSLGQEVVGSKTEGGSRAVARGRDWKYVEGFERGSFYHVTGTHEKRVDDSELGTLGERALETWRRRTGSSDVLADVVDGSLFDGRPLGATL